MGVTIEEETVDLFELPATVAKTPSVDGSSATPPLPTATALLVTPAQAAPRPEAPYVPGTPLTLTPSAPKPSKAKERAAAAYRATLEKGGEAVFVDVAPHTLPERIPEASVEALESAVEEITLATADLGALTLVKAYSEEGERNELTFKDAATLRDIVSVFPGARVVKISRPSGDDTFPPSIQKQADRDQAAFYDSQALAVSAATATAKPGQEPQSAVEQSRVEWCWGCDAAVVASAGDLCPACSA